LSCRSERGRGATTGAGVENQNTRSGRSAVRLRRQIRDSATVTAHPKVGPSRCLQSFVFPRQIGRRLERGGLRSYSSRRERPRLARSRILRSVREHRSEAPSTSLVGDMQALRKRHRSGISNLAVSEHLCSVTPCQSQKDPRCLSKCAQRQPGSITPPTSRNLLRRPGLRKNCVPAFSVAHWGHAETCSETVHRSMHHSQGIKLRSCGTSSMCGIDCHGSSASQRRPLLPSAVSMVCTLQSFFQAADGGRSQEVASMAREGLHIDIEDKQSDE